MINPYAQAFMIASRVDQSHLRKSHVIDTSKRRRRLFQRSNQIDPTKI